MWNCRIARFFAFGVGFGASIVVIVVEGAEGMDIWRDRQITGL